MKQNLFKRFCFVLALVLTLGLYANAQDAVWYVKDNKGNISSNPDDFWTVNSFTNGSSNYKWNYANINSNGSWKFGSSSSLSFTATTEFTLTVVHSYRSGEMSTNGRSPKLTGPGDFEGGVQLHTKYTPEIESTTQCEIYVIENLPAGDYSITRSKQFGLGYVSVTYTSASMTPLTTPTLTYVDGKVTISDIDAHADHVEYTVNGGAAQTYVEPFDVNDGDVIVAKAIATEEGYVDSKEAKLEVLVEGITVATPVIKQQNGTVGIYCSTVKSSIEYSLDNATWTAYARPFTLAENTTVYARASRANCTTSDVASLEVNSVIPPVEGATTIILGQGAFNDVDTQTLTGKDTDVAKGFIMTTIDGKTIAKDGGGGKFTISEGISRQGHKLSNGAYVTIKAPENMLMKRVTLYSYVNFSSENNPRPCYWAEINGTKYNAENSVLFGAYSNIADRYTNPDVRVFDLGKGVNEFSIKNTGEQVIVVPVVDIIEDLPMDIYFVGDDTEWNTQDENYKFSTTDGVTYTLTLPNGINGSWKICDGTWNWNFGKGASIDLNQECDVWFNSSANFDVRTSGETTITFTLVEGSDVQNSSIASRMIVEGQPFVEPAEHSIYFAGVQTGWDANKIEFAKNDNDIYLLTLDEGITGEWKIICDNSWIGPNGQEEIVAYERYQLGGPGYDGNFTLTTAKAATLEIEFIDGFPYITVKTSGYDAVYFDNTDSQWNAPHAYIWESETETPYKAWPGITMEKVPAAAVATFSVEKDVYEVAVPIKGYDKIIFTDKGAMQTDNLELVLRHVYKADGTHDVYDGTTGVDHIAVDDSNVAPVYYNLQGVRVENPTAGAFIMVRGSKVTKIIR